MSIEALAFIEKDLNLKLNQIAEAGKNVNLEVLPSALEVLLRKVRKHLKEERAKRKDFKDLDVKNCDREVLVDRIVNLRQTVANLTASNERGVREMTTTRGHLQALKKVVREIP